MRFYFALSKGFGEGGGGGANIIKIVLMENLHLGEKECVSSTKSRLMAFTLYIAVSVLIYTY